MFIGHFAVGLAGRRLTPRVSLPVWFAAAQLLDILWPILLLAGVEHVRIAPGTTAFTPLDFYDYPISHSLVGAIVWGALAAVLWHLFGGRRGGALLLFGGVLSHWVLDVIAHRPDMPVLPHGQYVGLGLWNSVALTLMVEITTFAAGIFIYARAARPRRSFWALMIVLLLVYLAAAFGPPPPNVTAIAWTSLTGVALILVWAWWTDRART